MAVFSISYYIFGFLYRVSSIQHCTATAGIMTQLDESDLRLPNSLLLHSIASNCCVLYQALADCGLLQETTMPSTSFRVTKVTNDEASLDEQYVQDAFHTYLKSSLAQAKVERLLDVELLSSAEGDLMITGTHHAFSDPSSRHSQSRTRSRTMPLLRSSTLHDQPALRAPPTHQ